MGELKPQRSPARTPRRAASAPPGRTGSAEPVERILQLQRQAGNHAVAQLLSPAGAQTAQRAPSPENLPVSTLNPTGTMNDQQWTVAYEAAVANPSVAAYEALFRDIAVTAGMDQIPGFNLASIPTTDGKTAQPGLNFTLKGGETGHTGWIDKTGTFGVKLNLTKKRAPDVAIAIIRGGAVALLDREAKLGVVRPLVGFVRWPA